MKRSVLFLLLLGCMIAARAGVTVPNRPLPEHLVNDFAQVLLPEQQHRLEEKLQRYLRSAKIELVVAVMEATGQEDLRDYSDAMMRKWKIGAGVSGRGLLLLVDMQSKKVFIGIGEGLKQQLIEETCMRIIRHDIVPAFQKQAYYTGLNDAVDGLRVVLIPLGELNAYTAAYDRRRRNVLAGILVVVFGSGLLLFFTNKAKRSA